MNTQKSNIYLFNPTCEYAVANGNASWHPNKLLQKMEFDMASLPMFFSKKNDFVIIQKNLSSTFISRFSSFSMDLPSFIREDELKFDGKLAEYEKNKLLPWGWSPAAHKKLSPLKKNCSPEFQNSPVFNWTASQKELYSKRFALGILKRLLNKFPNPQFIDQDELTSVCTDKTEIEALLNKWEKLMVKAPWSSSGRGLQPITKTPVHPKVWDKLLGIIKEQGYAIVEPYLNKIMDIAFQFQLIKGKIYYTGISNFSADNKGQYQGNYLNGLPQKTDSLLVEFIESIKDKLIRSLITVIEDSQLSEKYEGPFGVDALIFVDKKGQLKINPCLEINVRHNMGLLSLYLEKLIDPSKKGIFKTFYNPRKTFFEFNNAMQKMHPLKLSNQRIASGYLPLVDCNEQTLFGAYILV